MTFSSFCDQLTELDWNWSFLWDRGLDEGHYYWQPVIIFSGH